MHHWIVCGSILWYIFTRVRLHLFTNCFSPCSKNMGSKKMIFLRWKVMLLPWTRAEKCNKKQTKTIFQLYTAPSEYSFRKDANFKQELLWNQLTRESYIKKQWSMHVAKSDVLIFQNALTNNYIVFFIAHKGHEKICALSLQVLNKYTGKWKNTGWRRASFWQKQRNTPSTHTYTNARVHKHHTQQSWAWKMARYVNTTRKVNNSVVCSNWDCRGFVRLIISVLRKFCSVVRQYTSSSLCYCQCCSFNSKFP